MSCVYFKDKKEAKENLTWCLDVVHKLKLHSSEISEIHSCGSKRLSNFKNVKCLYGLCKHCFYSDN